MNHKRTDIINLIASKINAKSYLEIGVQNPDNNFNKINVEFKIGVDPYPTKENNLIFKLHSDDFFLHNCVRFDLIFIDGDHSHEQSLRDVNNSLKILNSNGIIIMHDVNPVNKRMQLEPMPVDARKWCGGCWRAFAELRMSRSDLYMAMIPDDMGLGIIKFGKQVPYKSSPIRWKLFEQNKNELMNIVAVDELKSMVF